MSILDWVLRVATTAAHKLLKSVWFVRRPRTLGAHSLALTPQGRLILVKLRYARGWRVPGGGRGAGEGRLDAALRELREEIGMTSHGHAALARDFQEATDFKRDTASLVIVRDVVYSARWTLEVEKVREFDLGELPEDMSPLSRKWIEALGPLL